MLDGTIQNRKRNCPHPRKHRPKQAEGSNIAIPEGGTTAKKEGAQMKHGVKPTRQQKKLIQSKGLDPAVWLIVKDTPERMELVHRYSDKTTRTIHKGE